MTCRKCGHEGPADARFCGACGAALEPEKRPAATRRPASSRRALIGPQVSEKSPWLAALLNAVPFPIGLGYVYLGRWWRVAGSLFARGLAFVAGVGVGVVALFATWDWYAPTGGSLFFRCTAFLAPQVFVLALMARDAWRLTDDHNIDAALARRLVRPAATYPRREPYCRLEWLSRPTA